MRITKRDGAKVTFDRQKIIDAINKALIQVDGALYETDTSEQIAIEIEEELMEKQASEVDVEQVQNSVEVKLMQSERPDVAKAYILYRERRTAERNKNSKLIKQIQSRLQAKDIANANANVDERSFSGREKEVTSDIMKTLALDYVLSEDVAKAHKEMLIYQHDLEKTAIGQHNCLQIDFKDILKNGFATRNGDVRGASNFRTACQLVAVIFQCQSQIQFGGVGSSHIDYDLAPFVKKSFYKHFTTILKIYKENLPDKYSVENYANYIAKEPSITDDYFASAPTEVYVHAIELLQEEMSQACEGLYHNLNTLESRAGSQVPFTSINYGRDTTPEGKLVTESLLKASIAGIGKHHRTSIFPISIFQYKKGCNADKGDPNYDLKQLALTSMSKRIYPNWVNGNYSGANEDDNNPDTFMSTMGCRSMLGYDRHGFGYVRTGRGNNVPNTIILPKLGIEYGICLGERKEPDFKGFWEAFEKTLKLCEKGLLERFELMVQQSPKAAPFMYGNKTIAGFEEDTYSALRHGTLAIGYVGVAEMCQALFGADHADSEQARNFALGVISNINYFAKEASERNNLNFTCYATPAENLCHTAAKSLRQQYGSIPNVTDREYLTNSHHVPVWKKISIFNKLRIESDFCKYPTGGCITYVELDSTFVHNKEAIETIIDYAFNEMDIPYLAFNFPIDSCEECGYQDEIGEFCPECGSKSILRLRRVTGYLTVDYHDFNKGKQKEVEERYQHSTPMVKAVEKEV